jgi:Zn-dependent protease/CBS domain-containing protein
MRNSIRLFTIAGIEVGIHYSWLIIFGLVTWALSQYMLPDQLGREPQIEYWLLGALTALLIFASVLVHELAHSFVAKARGLNARSITLFIFGGVSNLSGEPESPRTEFLVAIVGPLTSFALAGIMFALANVVDDLRFDVVVSYLFLVNLSLGLFNLVPGFPLDGGRVLRAVLWGTMHNLRRATQWAANIGKLAALLLFGLGLLLFVQGDVLNGVWFAAIAWFLNTAASASVEQVVLEDRLGRVKARDVAQPIEVTVPPGASVAELVEQTMLPRNLRAVPVVDNTRLVGVVTMGDVMKVPVDQRGQVLVAQIMGGRDGLYTITADTGVLQAIDLLAEHDLEQLPVLDGGQLIGMLTRADVMRQLQLREALTPSR